MKEIECRDQRATTFEFQHTPTTSWAAVIVRGASAVATHIFTKLLRTFHIFQLSAGVQSVEV